MSHHRKHNRDDKRERWDFQPDWREELPPEEHKFKGDMTHENHADNGTLARVAEIRSRDWSIYVEEIS